MSMMPSKAAALSLLGQAVLIGSLSGQERPAPDHGFVLAESEVIDEPNAGTLFRYRRPDGVGADVFVFPLPPVRANCDADCADGVVKENSEAFVNSIPELMKRGFYDTLWVVRTKSRKPPKGSWLDRGRLTIFRGERHRAPIESYRWLFLGQETLVEIRVTISPGAIEPAVLEQFVDAVLLSLPPHYNCPDGLGTDRPDVSFISVDVPMQSLRPMVDSVLTSLGFTFEFRSVTEGLWRATPRTTWPAGSNVARMSEPLHPAIEVAAITYVGEGGGFVGVVARPVCRSGEPGDNAYRASIGLAVAVQSSVRGAIVRALGLLE